MSSHYTGLSSLAGPLVDRDTVEMTPRLSASERRTLRGLGLFNVVAGLSLVAWIVWHLPWTGRSSTGALVAAFVVGLLMIAVEVIRVAQSSTLWAFSERAHDPVPMRPERGLRVASLTTIVPGKEPLDVVLETLRHMKQMEHDGPLDVWLLDEGNDPAIAEACRQIGVRHFSRKDVARWNTASGAFKAKTKAGNHNAWRDAHEHEYDVVAQMDPDHVPTRDFLTRTLGYFRDPDVGFVVAPQVYGNIDENWIAHGAAVQAYVFHGVIQRGGNGMDAPLLIGTNHLYRPSAWAQIDGYQDSIIEDHLTSMVLYASDNPATGNKWKGVYTPDIIAVGEGPTSFTDYFNQQKRWAYGIWEILSRHTPNTIQQLARPQRLAFSLLQSFYPSVALSFAMGAVLTGLLFAGATTAMPLLEWGALWTASMTGSLGLLIWLRRFNLAQHERSELGTVGLGLLLLTIPVYVAAAATFLSRKPLAYAVTAKGDLASPDTLRTFRQHAPWIVLAAAMLLSAAIGLGSTFPSVVGWGVVLFASTTLPVAIHLTSQLSNATTRLKTPRDTPVPIEAPTVDTPTPESLFGLTLATSGPARESLVEA